MRGFIDSFCNKSNYQVFVGNTAFKQSETKAAKKHVKAVLLVHVSMATAYTLQCISMQAASLLKRYRLVMFKTF